MITINVVKNLSTSRGKIPLHVNITINKNDFYAFYGASGAGKTTTLRMLAGLTKPDKGEIIVDGHTWFNSDKRINVPAHKRNVGLVFQDYALFPTMSVRKNLEFAAQKKSKMIDSILEMMNLKMLQNFKPSHLSGGQCQRVALARALVRSPELLLLDEPLSALDNELREHLQNLISDIHHTFHLTTVIVSHDIREVLKLSNQVAHFIVGQSVKCESINSFRENINSDLQIIGTIHNIDSQDIIIHIGNTRTESKVKITEPHAFTIGQKVLIKANFLNPVLIPLDNRSEIHNPIS
jgi:molybdate transport system ATP-binding protein